MAVALITGAVVGAAVSELLKAVLDAKDKVTNFKSIFESLESTLQQIAPRVHRLRHLNQKLDRPLDELKELDAISRKGEQLVRKCVQISCVNFVGKLRYYSKLQDLDHSLLRYFQTILLLDMAIDVKRIQVMAMLMRRDSDENTDNRRASFTQLPSQDSITKIIAKLWSPSMKELSEVTQGFDGRRHDSIPEEARKKLVLFEGCPYIYDLEDVLRAGAECLGTGTYGTTYWAYAGYSQIAVKRLVNLKVREIMEFQRRIMDLRKVGRHPNIMPPLGFFFSCDRQFLLYLYTPESLFSVLHGKWDCESISLDWDSRLKITLGAARGISHLHSNGDIHGNIKSSNVLLTEDFKGCISDYGLATLVNIPTSTYQESGYGAPEITKTRRVTQESDVYGFGVLLFEILTRLIPTEIDLLGWFHSFVREERKATVFDSELVEHNEHKEEMMQMLKIAMQCTLKDPDKRPKMDDVVRMIESIRPSLSFSSAL